MTSYGRAAVFRVLGLAAVGAFSFVGAGTGGAVVASGPSTPSVPTCPIEARHGHDQGCFDFAELLPEAVEIEGCYQCSQDVDWDWKFINICFDVTLTCTSSNGSSFVLKIDDAKCLF